MNVFREGDWEREGQIRGTVGRALSNHKANIKIQQERSSRDVAAAALISGYSCFGNGSVVVLKVNTRSVMGAVASLNHAGDNPRVYLTHPTAN